MDISDYNNESFIKALLWAGIEDYCPLWQALWEINALAPHFSEQQRIDITYGIIRVLMDKNAVRIVSICGDVVQPIHVSDVPQVLNDTRNWRVPETIDASQYCIDTTDIGGAMYQAM